MVVELKQEAQSCSSTLNRELCERGGASLGTADWAVSGGGRAGWEGGVQVLPPTSLLLGSFPDAPLL